MRNSPLPAPGEPLPHYVSADPFNPMSIEELTPQQERVYMASQWRLMWWKFKRHKVALWSGVFLLLLYASILFCEFLAPYNLETRNIRSIYAPPQMLHLFDDGRFVGPFVYGNKQTLDMKTLRRVYAVDKKKVEKLRFFCLGDRYNYFSLIPGSFHIVCPPESGGIFLLGTDRLGRDVLSRMIYGARISLTIGLFGIFISFTLGISIGGLAGYYGGLIDLIVQRIIEVLQSLAVDPVVAGAGGHHAGDLEPDRGLFRHHHHPRPDRLDGSGAGGALQAPVAARRGLCAGCPADGRQPQRIIARHLVPGFMSHLIASATISIPTMILGETALSFLGLGLRPPITSWGVLLNEAQNINVVALYPWLLVRSCR